MLLFFFSRGLEDLNQVWIRQTAGKADFEKLAVIFPALSDEIVIIERQQSNQSNTGRRCTPGLSQGILPIRIEAAYLLSLSVL